MKTATQTYQQTASEFSTKDIYLATIIKQSGIPIIRVEINGRQGIFIFQASEEIEEIKRKYDNGELKVDTDELVYVKALTFACRK
jgi:anti-sigma28 factor (negative regulator of flagellin synthesis)